MRASALEQASHYARTCASGSSLALGTIIVVALACLYAQTYASPNPMGPFEPISLAQPLQLA